VQSLYTCIAYINTVLEVYALATTHTSISCLSALHRSLCVSLTHSMSGKGMGKNEHGVYNDDPGPPEQKAGPSTAPSVPFIAGPFRIVMHCVAPSKYIPTDSSRNAEGKDEAGDGHHRPRILAHRTHLGCVPGLQPTALRSLRYRAPVDYLDLIQDGADQAAFPSPQSR
jgi:hypothetical protein